MLFKLKNGFSLFVLVIFPNSETLETWPSLRFLYAAELLLILISLPGSVLLVRALGNSVRLFHRNLIRVMQAHLIAATVSQISRISAVLFEIKIINRSEDSFDLLVFVTVAVRFASLSWLMTMIPAMITERVFASRYISDYEQLPRPWISLLINSAALVLAASYYSLTLLASLSQFYLFGLCIGSIVILAFSSVAFLAVHRSDVAILRDLTNKTGASTVTYTLSLKFQLEENVRVTKMLVRLSVGFPLWDTFATCLFMTAFFIFGETHPLGHLFYALFNNYVALTFAIFVWWLLWVIGEIRRLLSVCCCCFSFKADNERPPLVISGDNSKRIDDHFSRLSSVWAL